MILKSLKYASYCILIFGFFYGTYNVGLMQGKIQERLHGENVVLMSDCFESALFSSCKNTHVNSELFIKIYEDLQKELKEYEPNLLCDAPSSGSAQNINHPPSSFNGPESELGINSSNKEISMRSE